MGGTRFQLAAGPGPADLRRFLEGNELADAAVATVDGCIVVDVPDQQLEDRSLRSALVRHFGFMDLFFWVENGFEDVAFWDRPAELADAVVEIGRFFPADRYDVVATLEARGFFLAGALAHAGDKPVAPIRKYREAFAGLAGHTLAYRNWRGHDDRLWWPDLPRTSVLRGSRALFVDDVLETGNSLRACRQLLDGAGIALVGAMYLADLSAPAVREGFEFPIRSLLRMRGLRENTAPAL